MYIIFLAKGALYCRDQRLVVIFVEHRYFAMTSCYCYVRPVESTWSQLTNGVDERQRTSLKLITTELTHRVQCIRGSLVQMVVVVTAVNKTVQGDGNILSMCKICDTMCVKVRKFIQNIIIRRKLSETKHGTLRQLFTAPTMKTTTTLAVMVLYNEAAFMLLIAFYYSFATLFNTSDCRLLLRAMCRGAGLSAVP